jgi:hypothetical protein
MTVTCASIYSYSVSAGEDLSRYCEKRVFKNPRGLGYHYAFGGMDTGHTDPMEYFYSETGSSWAGGGSVFTDSGVNNGSVWIKEDSGGSQLVVYVVGIKTHDTYDKYIYYRRGTIADASSTISWGAIQKRQVDGSSDEVYFVDICMGNNSYIWIIAGIDDGVSGEIFIQRTQTANPGASPSWESGFYFDANPFEPVQSAGDWNDVSANACIIPVDGFGVSEVAVVYAREYSGTWNVRFQSLYWSELYDSYLTEVDSTTESESNAICIGGAYGIDDIVHICFAVDTGVGQEWYPWIKNIDRGPAPSWSTLLTGAR